MSFKDQKLDPQKIDTAIREFAGTREVLGPIDCGRYQQYELRETGAVPATLQIFIKENGRVTLHPAVGKNPQLSNELAQFLLNRCAFQSFEPKPLSLKFITVEDWKFLLEYLQSEGVSLTEEPLEHGIRFRAEGYKGDRVILHRYNSGAFVLQGRALLLHSKAVTALCELVPDKAAAITGQLACFDIDISAQQVIDEVCDRLPTAHAFLGETVTAIIAPALALAKIRADLPDYSAFVYPALRGLEGYIKQIFRKNGIIVKNAVGFAGYFEDTKLKSGVKIASFTERTAVENCYAFFCDHRHGLFHVDGMVETTRIIANRNEAISLVNDILWKIENTYVDIAKNDA